jgi:PleD family two-component response regulator
VVRFSSDAREYAREEVINRRLADGRMKTAPNISRMINNVCAFEPRTAFLVDLIKSDVLARAPDRRVLVLSDRKSQLQRVHDLLAEAGISVGFYWGGMKPAALKESSSRRVICATFPYAAEGMDIPELDTLVLASPKTDVVQSCGRITRFRPDDDDHTKNNHHHPPLVIDVVDTFAGIFVAQSRKRQRFYASRGFLIQNN